MLNQPIVLAVPHLTPAIQNNICNIPRGIVLWLRRICADDETFKKRSSDYQNYLIARYHKPSIVKKQFSEVKKKARPEARQKYTKQDKVSHLKFITSYNPALPNIHNIIQKNLSILKIFPSKSINTLYRREKTEGNFITFLVSCQT